MTNLTGTVLGMRKMTKRLVELLIERNMTISTAESCTGGLIAKSITDVSGASSVFGYGFVTYANEAKQKLLGVWEEALMLYGAVSTPVAVLMSRGARRVSGSDIAVSVTGIAGPGGGTKEKPVGLVYISLSTKDGTICKEFHFSGTRDEIRRSVCDAASCMAIRYLENLS